MSNKYRKARRNKAYRPKPVRAPMVVASALVLAPLEAIVDRLDIDGTVAIDGKGNPILQDMQTGEWYDAAGGIEGLIWHLEMHCTRHGVDLPLDGLRELHIAFKYCAPVQPSTMRKLREALPVLQRAMAMADKDDQLDLLHQTQIKAAMEASAV
jgi:hypothetical protein